MKGDKMSVKITIETDTRSNTLGLNGVEAITKGLRLLQLVGNEFERGQAVIVLLELGEKIQERPNGG
jgi:hypothetical protein